MLLLVLCEIDGEFVFGCHDDGVVEKRERGESPALNRGHTGLSVAILYISILINAS